MHTDLCDGRQGQFARVNAHRSLVVGSRFFQRQIRMRNQTVDVFAVLRAKANADTNGNVKFQSVDIQRACKSAQDFFDFVFGFQTEIQTAQQRDEMMSAGSEQNVLGGQTPFDAGGHFRQQARSDDVSRDGVDLPHAVRSDGQDGNLLFGGFCIFQNAGEVFFQVCIVADARFDIVKRQVLQLHFLLASFRNVAELGDIKIVGRAQRNFQRNVAAVFMAHRRCKDGLSGQIRIQHELF